MIVAKKCLGWREWVRLPDWGVNNIKAKLDTGAKTSALHAEDVKIIKFRGKKYVKFLVFPFQRDKTRSKKVKAELLDVRPVRSSGGHVTQRPVIITHLQIDNEVWPIEITLINRDIMGFRMLIGRQALKRRFLIDPGKSFLMKKKKNSSLELL